MYKLHRNYNCYVISQKVCRQGEKLLGCLKIINCRNKVCVDAYAVGSSDKCSRP